MILRKTGMGAAWVSAFLLQMGAAGLLAAETMPLWPGAAPGALGEEEKDIPKLTVYLPPADKAVGAAVVICPGGGYGHLAMDHEGHQVAQWLNSLGVAGIILEYRHRGKGYGHPAPLQDVQRALRTARARADTYGVDKNRIGVLGFSAGGHLASTAVTHFNDKVYEPMDDIDKESARPDFGVLIYPVISSDPAIWHKGSFMNLLGNDASPEMLEKFSNEKQVTAETPPVFLAHSTDDKAVPPENSIVFYQAMRKFKHPVEMHIYLEGGHGYGLGREGLPASSWPDHCKDWMMATGFLKKP